MRRGDKSVSSDDVKNLTALYHSLDKKVGELVQLLSFRDKSCQIHTDRLDKFDERLKAVEEKQRDSNIKRDTILGIRSDIVATVTFSGVVLAALANFFKIIGH